MKKYIYLTAALVMGVCMSSCSEKSMEEQALEKTHLTLTASFTDTKAVWDESGLRPVFVEGDKIGVFSDNNASGQYLEVVEVTGGFATLEGDVTSADTYHLVYPYSETASFDKITRKITNLDLILGGKANGYYPSKTASYACVTGSSSEVVFQNLCAILKFTTSSSTTTFTPSSFPKDNPIITVKGDGTASLSATQKTGYTGKFGATGGNPMYSAVAPGSVTMKNNTTGKSRTITVQAGRIYEVR